MGTSLFPIMLLLTATSIPSLCGKEEPPLTQQPSSSGYAAPEDVRLLANGLLQLGQSLRGFVHKTKRQLNDIFQKLSNVDHSFYKMSVLASEVKENEEELKKTTMVLQANNKEIKGLCDQISSKMEHVLKEKIQLQSKVEVLEKKLSSLPVGLVSKEQGAEISKLSEMVNHQEQSLVELLKAVKDQSEQLSHQKMKIQMLEEKLSASMLAQETIEETPEHIQTSAPTLIPYLTSGSSSTGLPSDCSELFNRGERVSGIYAIKPNGSEPFMAYCDMGKDFGATVIQRRKDGSVNFDQSWEQYENGFGDFKGEFWLGLRKIHSLASQGNSVLHIRLEDWKQETHFMQYRFSLSDSQTKYTVHLTPQSGDLLGFVSNSTELRFFTKDWNDDTYQRCAHQQTGGWWFNACDYMNLNGRYLHLRPKSRSRQRGIQLGMGQRGSFALKSTQISVYPSQLTVGTGQPPSD